MKKIALSLVLLLITAFSVNAQDIHFSQFYAAPLTLNPAMTGAFNGQYRVGAIYRNQYRSVVGSVPYRTISAFADGRIGGFGDDDYIGIGMMFFSDKAGTSNFSTNQFNLSAAYHKALGYQGKSTVVLGFQGGYAQRNVNYANITYNNQFNGSGYDPNINSGEGNSSNNFTFWDYSFGLLYYYRPTDRTGLYAGGGIQHINTPSNGFNGGSDLNMKYVGHLGGQINISESLDLIPRAIFLSQGSFFQTNLGAKLRIIFPDDIYGTALYAGASMRISNGIEQPGLDAAVFEVGAEWNKINLGFAYDVNISDLNKASAGRGAFEISLIYIGGEVDKRRVMCPSF